MFIITNADNHFTSFYGFKIDENAITIKFNKLPKLKIEFYSNSITCGHGVEVPIDTADSGKPEYFNTYKAYSAFTVRYFNSQYRCTAKSGIGIMLSWFNLLMPEIFNRVNPNDKNSQWNFT